MEELIAKRYVNALSEVATSEQKIAYSEVLGAIAELLQDEKVAERLTSPLIPATEKTAFVLDGIKGSDSNLENFIKILGENSRLDLIPTIARSLNQELQKESNNYEGVVTSSNALSDADLEDLQNSLKKYTGSTIRLTQTQSAVEGIRVSVEDLGIEVNFSKQRVKEQLIDFITKSL
ncbi:F0F1 ATP synthase subunit delta [Sulfurovum sp. bin170]|uniref:F0F1 ATP synthase subunit delta n=1 Tax=Sulfurovum sp. bin170 TaxID=2695268 RepID=UPI0013DF490C|nr:F0F1 ATP synthase subunit delta [Sulfurovum sp. bin170]NEW60446.1 F0F1 ATP synthase subunit delta [Sulfurovum sp. bin170]